MSQLSGLFKMSPIVLGLCFIVICSNYVTGQMDSGLPIDPAHVQLQEQVILPYSSLPPEVDAPEFEIRRPEPAHQRFKEQLRRNKRRLKRRRQRRFPWDCKSGQPLLIARSDRQQQVPYGYSGEYFPNKEFWNVRKAIPQEHMGHTGEYLPNNEFRMPTRAIPQEPVGPSAEYFPKFRIPTKTIPQEHVRYSRTPISKPIPQEHIMLSVLPKILRDAISRQRTLPKERVYVSKLPTGWKKHSRYSFTTPANLLTNEVFAENDEQHETPSFKPFPSQKMAPVTPEPLWESVKLVPYDKKDSDEWVPFSSKQSNNHLQVIVEQEPEIITAQNFLPKKDM